MALTPALAQEKTISCANDTCTANFSAQSLVEKPFYTALDVGNNNENITVSVPTNQTPRSIRLNVKNGSTPRNLLLDLSSAKASANAGSTVIIGDMFNTLQVRLNGYNGVRGRDASQICAQRLLAGQYGLDAKNFFEQRRAADPALNPGRCDRIDLSYLQSFNFTCDDPTYQELTGTNPVVEVTRLRFKARCSGVLVRDLCIRHKREVQCPWYLYDQSCSKKDGCRWVNRRLCNAPYTVMAEEYFSAELSRLGVDSFCRNRVGGPACGAALVQVEGFWHRRHPLSTHEVGTYIPLSGSIMDRLETVAYGSCPAYWTKVRTESVVKIAYDETGTDCDRNSVSIPEDPNRVIPWAYSGMAQEPQFGTESLQCRVGECPVNSTISDVTRSLDVIVPESGDNGTQQGNGVALVYDVQVESASAVIGQAGSAGLADLDSPEGTKFCGKIRDYNSDGENSEFARNPSVSFRRYNWRAIRTTGGGNNGVPPPASNNNVEVYKKMDSSARFLLAKELL